MAVKIPKLLRIGLWVVLTPIVLILLVGGALYIPAVQDIVVRYATQQASEALGMNVEIGRLRLSFPLGVRLDRVAIWEGEADTLLRFDEATLSVRPIPLIHNRVEIPSLDAEGMLVNYRDSLETMRVEATLATLGVEDVVVRLDDKRVYLASLGTRGTHVYVHMADTTASEPSEPLGWHIVADALSLEDTEVEVVMPLDTMHIDTRVERLVLAGTDVRLDSVTRVAVGEGNLEASLLRYRRREAPRQEGVVDNEYIEAKDIVLGVREVVSEGSALALSITEGRLRERSGIALTQLQGVYTMDDAALYVGDLAMRTEHSSLFGSAQLPWSLFGGDDGVPMMIAMDGSIGMDDLRHATGQDLVGLVDFSERERPTTLRQLTAPISFGVNIDGTLTEMNVNVAQMLWEDVLEVDLAGTLYNLTKPKERRGKLILRSGMHAKANSLLPLISRDVVMRYNIPAGLILDGSLELGGGNHTLNLRLRDRDAEARLSGRYNEFSQAYKAHLDLRDLNLRRFMPSDSIGFLRAEIEAEGRGFDPLSKRTNARFVARLHQLDYQSMSLGNITADGTLSGGELSLALNSFNPGLNASLLVDGLLSANGISTNVVLDSEEIDLAALGLATDVMRGKGRLSGELRSDMKETHSFVGRAEGVSITFGEETISPEEILLDVRTSTERVSAEASSGDLKLVARVDAGTSALMAQSDKLMALTSEVQRQIMGASPMTMHLEEVVASLPRLDLDLEVGRANALMTYLKRQRIALESLVGHVRLRPTEGIEGHISLRDIRQDTLRINCVDLDLKTLRYARAEASRPTSTRRGRTHRTEPLDSMALAITGTIDKQAWRRQPAFRLDTRVLATLQQARLDLDMLDGAGRTEHHAALQAQWDGSHYRISLPEESLTLAYERLGVSPDNYIELDKLRYLAGASLMLSGREGTSLALEANDLEGTGQDGVLVVRRLRLEDFRALGLPDVSGILNSDIRYSRMGGIGEQPVITGDLSVQEFRYEDKALGHFATALFYEPRNDDSHYITAEVSYKGLPALSIDGIYQPRDKESPLSGSLRMSRFPLEIANPFVSQYATYLGGTASGQLALSGSLSDPRLVGELRADTTTVELRDYATTLRLDTAALRMSGTALHFNRYAVYSSADGADPIYIDGRIEALGPRAMEASLKVQAEEITLFDQRNLRSESQLVYGRLIASANLDLTGKLNALKMRGRLGILGGTNCTYVMREGGLDATDHHAGLVSFVDFADTLFTARPVVEAELGGMDMNVSLQLEPSVRFGVDLTADGRDYVRMQGGGTMQLRYPPFGEMSLVGRYEMSGGGTMHYTMPVVGGKLFTIDPSGYVRFEGKVSNPYVHLVASQQVRAAVGENGAKTPFTVSIKLEDYIEKINLSFDLAAPENLSVQNSIAMMTAEERGKQAIGLLATGTYLAAGGGNFDGALTSLLQSQINSVAGSLLQGTDISLGMESGNEGSGAYTNYTYSFSRRFYNDRIRILIGGKIQTGNTNASRDKSLIDNVSLEYQIDQAGEHYAQIYHSLITDNVLEGEYTETGIGYSIRRKLQRLTDIFDFRRRRRANPLADGITLPADSSATQLWSLPTFLSAPDSIPASTEKGNGIRRKSILSY